MASRKQTWLAPVGVQAVVVVVAAAVDMVVPVEVQGRERVVVMVVGVPGRVVQAVVVEAAAAPVVVVVVEAVAVVALVEVRVLVSCASVDPSVRQGPGQRRRGTLAPACWTPVPLSAPVAPASTTARGGPPCGVHAPASGCCVGSVRVWRRRCLALPRAAFAVRRRWVRLKQGTLCWMQACCWH